MTRTKLMVISIIIIFIFLFGFLIADYYKDERIQAEIDTDFMSDYGNLIIGMLNKSIQNEEVAIHKYDIENTRYGFRLTELYSHNSYLQHEKFKDIIQLLDQSSGCDAWYEIDMDKELYDNLNALGQAIFSKPQKCTDAMLKETWEALSDSVDFKVK